jgi:hypothetical protein
MFYANQQPPPITPRKFRRFNKSHIFETQNGTAGFAPARFSGDLFLILLHIVSNESRVGFINIEGRNIE